jgi:acetolactate synthase regulatory subunit
MDIEIELEGAYRTKEIERMLRTARSKGFDFCGIEISETKLIIKCR